MGLLPTTLGTRPRLAVEIRPEGVVAARAEDAAALLMAVSQGVLAEGSVVPGLRHGNVVDRAAVVASVKRVLEAVTLRERQTTLIIPDAAVRVLLLDFDALPTKTAEALPVVRFRLKKLLPFDADDAVVSYQILSTGRNLVRVLAVAVPREVLREYESIVREAGFEPGAVLPSTLAALSALDQAELPVLLVNAGETAVTTAIVQGGVLLLHRTVDLGAEGMYEADAALAVAPTVLEIPQELLALPLVDVDETSGEWAMQEPLNGYGVLDDEHISAEADALARRLEEEIAGEFAQTQGFAQTQEQGDGRVSREQMLPLPPTTEAEIREQRMHAAAREVSQAVSVAAAYFVDTLQIEPGVVLAVGTLGADVLEELLHESGWSAVGDAEAMRVREMVEPGVLTGGATTTRAPLGWLGGVRGALRN